MTPTILIIVTFIAIISFTIAWVFSARMRSTLQAQLQQEILDQQDHLRMVEQQKENDFISFENTNSTLKKEFEAHKKKHRVEIAKLTDQLHQHQVRATKFESILMSERKRILEKQQETAALTKSLNDEVELRHQAEQLNRKLEVRLEEQQIQNQKALAQLEENKDALKQEFKHLAHDIFETRGRVLTEQHQQQLNSVLEPLKAQLGDFKSCIEEAHQQENVDRAELRQQLDTMYQLNNRMSEDANKLAQALKGDKNSPQSHWGEIQIEKLLERSGLTKGQEYQRVMDKTEDQQNKNYPDFIVHLPEDKHLIIDSSVPLTDYVDYINTEDEHARHTALTQHIQTLHSHINTLHQKDYLNIPSLRTPDLVFMFIPVEPAFMMAFQHDPSLFNEAFDKHIVVVTPTTLLATLRTVANLWTVERQNINARHLAEKGQKMYDKLRIFIEKMEVLDLQINDVRTTYNDAMTNLKTGQDNLVSHTHQFLELGVQVKKELPSKTLSSSEINTVYEPTVELPDTTAAIPAQKTTKKRAPRIKTSTTTQTNKNSVKASNSDNTQVNPLAFEHNKCHTQSGKLANDIHSQLQDTDTILSELEQELKRFSEK